MTKHNISNRLLAMVMAISMMVTMFAGITFVSAATPATEIWFAGATLNADTPYAMQIMKNEREANGGIIASATSEVTDPAAQKHIATFDATTGTLTFVSGYDYEVKDGTVEPELAWNTYTTMQLMPETNTKYGIKATGDLTIDLGGYINGLWLDWNSNIQDVNTTGIDVDGDLTIKGDGYLRITASAPYDVDNDYADPYTAYGVKATGDVNFDGGQVYFFERPYNTPQSGDTATFVYADGDINLNGGKVKMRGMKRTTWLTKFNKTPNYDADAYVVEDNTNIEIEHATDQTLGYTRYAGDDYGNLNNATYSPAVYLSFDVDGGSAVADAKVAKGSTVDLINYTTEKSGYNFGGWFADAELTTPASVLTLAADTTVYAKWAAKPDLGPATEIWFAGATLNADTPYAMQVMKNASEANGGIVASATGVVSNAAAEKLLATFDAATGTLTYNGGFALTPAADAVEPEGNWNTYTTMQLYGDTNTKYGIKSEGDLIIDLNGYVNGLWLDWNNNIKDVNTAGIDVNGNLTIKDSAEGGYLRISASAPQDVDGDYEGSYTAYGIKATGDVNLDGGKVYIFERPYVDPVAGDTSTFIYAEGDINLNGGSLKMRGMKRSTWMTKYNKLPVYNAENYIVSNDENLEIDAASGKTLGYVGDKGAGYGNTNNVTYTYAPMVNLIFDVDGGDALDPVKVRSNVSVDLNQYRPTKTDYVFGGWYTDAELTNKVYSITLTEDTTIYAKWMADAGIASEVVYAGVTLNAETPYLVSWVVSGSGLQIKAQEDDTLASGESVLAYFDATTGKLTYMSGMNLTTETTGYEPDFGWNTYVEAALIGDAYYAIKANGDLIIDLNGYNNFINLNWNKLFKNDLYGIYADGDVTIQGEGYLKVPATPAANTDATNGDNNGVHYSYGIYASGGDANLIGGTVMVYSRMYERWEAGSNANSIAVYADGDINLGGTALKIRYQDLNGSAAIKTFGKDPVGLDAYKKTDIKNVTLDSGSLNSLGFAYVSETTTNNYCFNYAPVYTVSFNTNEGTAIADVEATKGSSLNLSNYKPTKEGFDFGGWFADAELTTRLTNLVVTGDTTVYAKWRTPAGPATEVFAGGAILNAETPYLVITSEEGKNVTVAAAAELPAEEIQLLATFEEGKITFNRGYKLVMGDTNNEVYYEYDEPTFYWNSQLYDAVPEGETTKYGFKANGNLIVDLNGYNNHLFADWNAGIADNNVIGIYADGDVTIIDSSVEGKGYLAITASPSTNHTNNSHAIMAAGNINLNGGTVVAYDGEYNAPVNGASTVFFFADGAINLNGATVKVRTMDWRTYEHFNVAPTYDADKYTVKSEPNVAVVDFYFGSRARGTVNYSDTYRSNSGSYLPSFTVSFSEDGIDPIKVISGEEVDIYAAECIPTKDGFEFGGWYTDEECTIDAASPYEVTKDITFYAKWRTPSANASEIFYAGVTLNETTPYLIVTTPEDTAIEVRASAAIDPAEGEKHLATFDAATGTLTYVAGYDLWKYPANFTADNGNSYTNAPSAEYGTYWHTYAIMQTMGDTGNKYGIYADGNLTIDLGGFNNGFWVDWNGDIKDVNLRGIEVLGNLTIKGDGYLRVTANATADTTGTLAYDTYGVKADGNINLEGGMLYVYDSLYGVNVSMAKSTTFVNAGGMINLDGGSVMVRGEKGRGYITKFNKLPVYNADNYVVSDDTDLDLAESTDLGKTLGFTRVVAGNGNSNNASYRAKKTVTFVTDGGASVAPVESYEHAILDLTPYTTSKIGEEFKGWTGANVFGNEAVVSGDTELTVAWKTMKVLSFNTDGGSEIGDMAAMEGTEIDLAPFVPTKAGFTFGGWYTDEYCEDENLVTTYVLEDNSTLYAKWISNLTVTFNVGEGVAIDALSVAPGAEVDLTPYTTTREGYTFDGWYAEETLSTSVTTITVDANTIVYAKWAINYTLSFDVDGGSAIAPVSLKEGTQVDPSVYVTTKTGAEFAGWYMDADFTFAATMFSLNSDITLYAKWEGGIENPSYFSVEADKETAAPGETITYTIYLQQPDTITCFGANIVLPEGWTYVADSAVLDTATFGSTFEFVPEYNMLFQWYSSSGDDYTNTNKIALMTFDVLVPANATLDQDYTVTLKDCNLMAGSTQDYADLNHTIIVVPSVVTVEEAVATGVKVSGNITSFLVADGTVTVELVSGGTTVYSATGTTSYAIEGVADGTYTIKYTKANHAVLEEEITIAGSDVAKNVKICPKGDVNNDGGLSTVDFSMANAHAKDRTKLTGYRLKCADVVGGTTVTTADAMRINSAAKDVSPLW